MRGRKLVSLLLCAATCATVATVVSTAVPAAGDEPIFVDWTSLLPSFTDAYDPNSANDCTAGRPHCVDATIKEMQRRFDPLAQSCSNQAVFSLAYLRTTQTYEWARNQPGYFNDTPWVNHEDAVFARYYFNAYDAWSSGDTADTPAAWQIAFNAAANNTVTGAGNLLLGMNAHVNRDLPFVLASISITYPDGTTRKPDHDKVNQFLNAVLSPLMAEGAARFDPWINSASTPYQLGYTGLFQLLAAWRESAWREAEALTDAPTPQARALVAQQIENSAAAEAQLIVASNPYAPVVETPQARASFCASHNGAAAPTPYAFGQPSPW